MAILNAIADLERVRAWSDVLTDGVAHGNAPEGLGERI
jgi:hypothetical protein